MAKTTAKRSLGSKIATAVGSLLLGTIIAFGVVWGTGYAITGKANPSQWRTNVDVAVNGKDGADGKDGLTPYIGESGNWFVGDTDLGVKAAGQDGTAGEDGKDGETPYIGENGNWFIGETDTGVKAAGQDGADGQNAAKLYIHNIVAPNIGETGSQVSFVIKSTEPNPYTANTLPVGEIVAASSPSGSEIPICVQINTSGKAEILIFKTSGSYTMHYTADTITDTVTEA